MRLLKILAAIAAMAIPLAFASPSQAAPCGTTTTVPTYSKVMWVIMENKKYSSVIGSSSAPYETSLAHSCATDTNWADAGSQYNSLPNYIALTSGITSSSMLDPFKCDCEASSSVSVTADNIFRQVRAAGFRERSYQEDMPSNCFNDSSGDYRPKHNPALYYWGASDRAACSADDLPMTPLDNAIASGVLPRFSLVTPDLCNDTHNCSVATGDAFLKSLLTKVFAGPNYSAGHMAVFVLWDEDAPIPNIIASPSIVPGSVSASPVNHYSALRATEGMLGLPKLGAAETAPNLRALFRF